MNLKKLNEDLNKLLNEKSKRFTINEISDKLKASYIAGRQAQLDKAKDAMQRAKRAVKKSDDRQLANLPDGTDKETATEILQDLEIEMKRLSKGSDWRLNTEDKTASLEVRYWGDWEGDDGSGDYDWQTLTDRWQNKLYEILKMIQKRYGVKVYGEPTEKNWIVFDVNITKLSRDSVLDIDTELKVRNLIKKVKGQNISQEKVDEDWNQVYFTIQLYNSEGYKPVLEDVQCALQIPVNYTDGDTIYLDIDGLTGYDSFEDAFNAVEQLIKDRNEEVENQKRAKKVKRENLIWLDTKLLKEKPQVIWLNVVDDHNIQLKTNTDDIKLQKKEGRNKCYIVCTINNKVTKTVIDPSLEFKDWVEEALKLI